MAFTSASFAPFLLAVWVGAYLVPSRLRPTLLLASSYLYYASWGSPLLVAVLVAITLVAYATALAGSDPADDGHQGSLWAGIGAVLLAMYAPHWLPALLEAFRAGVHGAPAAVNAAPVAIAAIGVSYYGLQAISYLIDVRSGALPAERNLATLALSFAFFPKLVQGPIERSGPLLPQLRFLSRPRLTDLGSGAQLFLWGLFQKVVVADRLAPFVEEVYGDLGHQRGLPIALATYFFAFQLYCDFAGYTDMALGVGRMFGVRLSANFRAPYLATSIGEFWRRWHISFSSWLLDYVFRPLQLTLRDWRTVGTPVALLLTFLVSGLWHGLTWGFVAWGVLHGTYLASSALLQTFRRGRSAPSTAQGRGFVELGLRRLATFHLVSLAWIFFRSPSPADAASAAVRLVTGLPSTVASVAAGSQLDMLLYLGQGPSHFAGALALLALTPALRRYFERVAAPAAPPSPGLQALLHSSWARTVLYASMIYLAAFRGAGQRAFLYAQF